MVNQELANPSTTASLPARLCDGATCGWFVRINYLSFSLISVGWDFFGWVNQ